MTVCRLSVVILVLSFQGGDDEDGAKALQSPPSVKVSSLWLLHYIWKHRKNAGIKSIAVTQG